MKKVQRKLTGHESVRLLTNYLHKHFEEKNFAVKVTLERWVKPRSDNQNATMHMWFGEIAEQIGDDPESVKESLKAMFLPQVEGINGVMHVKGTRQLSTPEAMDFMQQIQALAVDMGWELTQPYG